MKIDDFRKLNDHFNTRILFCYTGQICQEMLEDMTDILEKNFILHSSPETGSRLLLVFIEQIQNIIHYSAEKETYMGRSFSRGSVLIGQEDGAYYVLSGNMIDSCNRKRIEDSFKMIRGKSREELNIYYKDKIRMPQNSETQGAGLGFIDMARKSAKPLEYSIEKARGGLSYFSVKSTL